MPPRESDDTFMRDQIMNGSHMLRLWENFLAIFLYYFSIVAIRPDALSGDVLSQLIDATSTKDGLAYAQLIAFGLLIASTLHGLFHGRMVRFHLVFCLAIALPFSGNLVNIIQYLRSGFTALFVIESLILTLPAFGFDPFESSNPFRFDGTAEGKALTLGGSLYSWFLVLWLGPTIGGGLLLYVTRSWSSLSPLVATFLIALVVLLTTIALFMWLVTRPYRIRR